MYRDELPNEGLLTRGSDEPMALPKRSGLAKNLLHLGFGQVTTTALTVFFSAAIARTLGAADFGLLYLITSIANFAYVFVDWGHGPYVTREVALRPHRSGDLMGSVLAVRVAMTLVVGVLTVALTWLLRYDLNTQFLTGVLILSLLPQYLGLSFSWAFRGRERMEFDALIQVALKFSALAVALVVLALGGRLVALLIGYAISGTITLVLALVIYHRLGFPRLRVTRSTAIELVRDGAAILAVALVVAVQPSIDANILYKLVPQAVLGWHGTAWAIAGTLVAPATILGAAMYPRLSRATATPAEFKKTLRTVFRPLLLIAVLGSGGTYLFASVAIDVVYGHRNYGPAADILSAFAPALILIYLDMLFAHAILALQRAGPLAKAKVVAVIATTAAELAVVPWFQTHYANGGIGIVVSLACGELVMVGACIVLLRDVIDKAMFVDVFRGLLAGAMAVGIMHALPAISPVLGIPLFILLYALLALLVGAVTRADLDLLTASFGKRGASPEAAAVERVGPERPFDA